MKNIDYIKTIKVIMSILLFLLILIFLPTFLLLFIIAFPPLFIFIKLLNKDLINTNKTYIDFSNEKDYCRELIEEYSIAELAFLDNLEIDEEKVAICSLLNMKLKKIIDINENGIKIIEKDFSNLKETEKYLLENCKDGRIDVFPSGDFELLSIKEAKKDGLVENVKNTQNAISKKKLELILLFILFNIIVAFILFIFYSNQNIFYYILITYIFSIYLIVNFLGIYFKSYKHLINKTYKRTEKGEKINIKLEGLKKYIQDFGDLGDENSNTLVVWEGYLIYSCLFGINKEIIKNMSKFVKFRSIKFEKNI